MNKEGKRVMKKVIHEITCTVLILTFIALFVYLLYPSKTTLALLITGLTTSYHFVMRIIVGHSVDAIMKNKANYYHKWYKISQLEEKIYEVIKVGQWKKYMPTYSPESFSLKHHTLEEIVMAMCQSEIVHEIIVVLSFVPVLAIPWFGEPEVFIITSFLAACFDMIFVIMQRYNRPRIIKLIEKRRSRK